MRDWLLYLPYSAAWMGGAGAGTGSIRRRKLRQKGGKLLKNGEGYTDPTASRAIHEADRLPKHIMDVVHILKLVAGMVGLRVKSVELEDRKTGKRYWYGR